MLIDTHFPQVDNQLTNLSSVAEIKNGEVTFSTELSCHEEEMATDCMSLSIYRHKKCAATVCNIKGLK